MGGKGEGGRGKRWREEWSLVLVSKSAAVLCSGCCNTVHPAVHFCMPCLGGGYCLCVSMQVHENLCFGPHGGSHGREGGAATGVGFGM